MLRLALVLSILSAAPGYASPRWFSSYDLPVNRVSATTFEVIEKRGAGPREIWCAAARHAIQSLGKQNGRIYIDRPRADALTAAGHKGVGFTTRAPQNAAPTGLVVTTSRVGASLPVAHAVQFCRDQIIEPEDWF